MQSIHEKLERVRKPRVHIKYEVETEGGVVQKELPFVVGVLGDFAGDNKESLKPLKERKFIQIDRDNFNDIMKRVSPSLSLQVENALTEEGGFCNIELKFNKMEDFEPEAIVNQVPVLKKLLDLRMRLQELLSKTDRSDALESLLAATLKDKSSLLKLAQELESDIPFVLES